MTFPHPYIPAAAGVSSAVTVSKPSGTGSGGSGADGTSHTISTLDFGTASSTRQIFAAIQILANTGTPDFSSVTIGGVSATLIAKGSSNGASRVGLYAAVVPTGTSGDVVVTTSSTALAVGCCIWIVANASIATAYDTAEDVDDSDPQTGSIDCEAGGAIFGVFGIRSGTLGASGAWSGVNDNVYADYTAEATRYGAGAAQTFAAAQTALAVSYNQNYTAATDPTTLWAAVSKA